MRRRRGFPQFSLSFLDCMSCGLGAVVLLFMIINHATQVRATERHRNIAEEVSRLESETLERSRTVESMAAALEETEEALEAAEARAVTLEAQPKSVPDDPTEAQSGERLASLREEVRALDRELASLRDQEGNATRSFSGEGNRQYLTGLQMGGRHILILLDTSASMLSDTIVDVLRRRNMSAGERRSAPKWRRAVATLDWITTQVPREAQFQIYAFDVTTRPVLDGTEGRWLETGGGGRLNEAVEAARRIVPQNGTSLHRAFLAAGRLTPKPDAIYLLTDGLPTQGRSAEGTGAVSGGRRLRLYREALRDLPQGVPLNVILFPIEGDPLAASVFWQLAQRSGGAFLSPSRDWP